MTDTTAIVMMFQLMLPSSVLPSFSERQPFSGGSGGGCSPGPTLGDGSGGGGLLCIGTGTAVVAVVVVTLDVDTLQRKRESIIY